MADREIQNLLKVNSFWIKIKGQNFASQVLSRHTFKIPRKKGRVFFNHRGTLRTFSQMKSACVFISFNVFLVSFSAS